MKKKLLIPLLIVTVMYSFNSAYSKNINDDLFEAINMYKAGNYSECYLKLDDIIKNDPANPLVYYYMAITSAQVGKKEEAISNYEKAIALADKNSTLMRYAKKGKRCIETPDKCSETPYDSLDEEFILNKTTGSFSKEVKGQFEKLKLENFMREMNRVEDIDTQKFKEYQDFSSNPTNDEIVAALRVLQKAGFNNILGSSNNLLDASILTGGIQQNPMLNMMGNSSLNPQLIQALLTNNMTQGF